MSFFEIVIFYEFLNSVPQILNLPPASYLASNVGKRHGYENVVRYWPRPTMTSGATLASSNANITITTARS